MRSSQVIDLVRKDAKLVGVRTFFSKGKQVVSDNISCSGYFSDEAKVLAVATGVARKNWIEILIHEYSHMQQWKENCPEWKEFNRVHNKYADKNLVEWPSKKCILTPKQSHETVMSIIQLELDCDKRAVKFIKKWNLNINIEEYIQKANAYLYVHHLMAEKGLWYSPGKAPHSLRTVWKHMPKTFQRNYSKIPKKLIPLFEPCFKK